MGIGSGLDRYDEDNPNNAGAIARIKAQHKQISRDLTRERIEEKRKMGTYRNVGKQVLFVEEGWVPQETHICDAVDNEKAHSIATMMNGSRAEDGGPLVPFDYMAEADKTCSIEWNPQYVDRDSFVRTLRNVIENADCMNVMKKLFFRGRTPDDLGMVMPLRQHSAAALTHGATSAEINIAHGIIGLITEVGELAEQLQAWIEGGSFDGVHTIEEAGDVLWYVVRVLRGSNATIEQAERANIDKLHGRHGEAFDVFRDANRDLGRERERLENTIGEPLLIEDAIVAGIEPLAPRDGDTADMVDRIAAAAHTPRQRNDPPLPPSVGKLGDDTPDGC